MDISSNSREMELKMHHTRVGIELSELESYAMSYYLVLQCTQSRSELEKGIHLPTLEKDV